MFGKKKPKEAAPKPGEGWIKFEPTTAPTQAPPPTPPPAAPARNGPGWSPVQVGKDSDPGVASPPVPPARYAREKRIWSDPVLSPWAPPEGSQTAAPATPVYEPPRGPGSTKCPRCSTPITYNRIGPPPWDALCPTCGAHGRMSK